MTEKGSVNKDTEDEKMAVNGKEDTELILA